MIQDDVILCDGFRDRAEAAIAEHPTVLIAFFVPDTRSCGAARMMYAMKDRQPYADISGASTIPVVALSWPVEFIEPFLRECKRSRWANQRGDDTVVAYFVKDKRLTVLATAPSFVEHPDVEPSLVRGQDFNGCARFRRAAFFAG